MIFRYKNISISLDEELYKDYISNHLKTSNTETGGIICGYYSSDLTSAVVTKMCLPTPDSILKQASFQRGVQGLKNFLKNEWDDGKYYLGDWHLHPNVSPIASKQDLMQLENNAKDKSLKCPEPIMIILGGNNNCITVNIYIFIDGDIKVCERD